MISKDKIIEVVSRPNVSVYELGMLKFFTDNLNIFSKKEYSGIIFGLVRTHSEKFDVISKILESLDVSRLSDFVYYSKYLSKSIVSVKDKKPFIKFSELLKEKYISIKGLDYHNLQYDIMFLKSEFKNEHKEFDLYKEMLLSKASPASKLLFYYDMYDSGRISDSDLKVFLDIYSNDYYNIKNVYGLGHKFNLKKLMPLFSEVQVLNILKYNSTVFKYISDDLKNDKNFLTKAFELNNKLASYKIVSSALISNLEK